MIIVVFSYIYHIGNERNRYKSGKKVSNKNLSLVNSSSIVGLQIFFNTVVVLRSGEFLYLYLMKRENFKYQDGISYLIITRVLDFFCVSLLFVVSYSILVLTDENMIQEVFVLGLVISFCLVIGWAILFYLMGLNIEQF